MNIKTQPQPKESELKSGLVEIFGGVENFEIYQNLKTHQDRVKYVWESRMVQNLFMAQAHALKNTEAFLKSDRESKRLRELGNAAFKSARDKKALELYSEALAHADRKGSENAYALALANRSAVHVRIGGDHSLRSALLDIGRALEAGHPSPLKLLERKCACLEGLGHFSEACKVLEQMISLENLPKEKYDKLIEKLKSIRDLPDKHLQNDTQNWSLDFSPNSLYPSISSAIDIQFTSERGRFGVASRDIQVGEPLIFEAPTASKIKTKIYQDHCEHCMKSCFGTFIPCLNCTNARYCSEKCLEIADKTYHKFECSSYTKNANASMEQFLTKLKGSDGALGFYKLLVKLVAQKPMEFFKNHKDWLGGNGTEKPINATIFPSLIRKKFA